MIKKEKPSNLFIEMQNIFKEYKKKVVLNNINLKIENNDRIGIIGANGSGKTTLVEIIAGIRKSTKGTLLKKDNLVIGIQFQDSKYPVGISILDMISFYLETFNIKYSSEQLEELLKTYQLFDIRKKQITTLSGGQQQRLNILLALIHKPQLIILDEISTGLDIEVKEDIFNFLNKNIIDKDIALLLISHGMNEIERFCNKIIFLHEGVIKEQVTVKEAINEYGSVDQYTRIKLKHYKE